MHRLSVEAAHLLRKEHKTIGEMFLRLVAKDSAILFVLTSKDGAIGYANRRFAEIVDSPMECLVGTNLFDYILGFTLNEAISDLGKFAPEKMTSRRLLNFAGPRTMPHSFHCRFFRHTKWIALVGEPEVGNMERMQEQFIAINNELANLNRESNRERARAEHALHELQRAEEELRKAHGELEERVEQRTAELSITNAKLTREIIARERALEALFVEKERAQTTLHSIGDAVITTNAASEVEYLNPPAEALTGWPLDEARGQPLTTVFRIVDEQTREPVADPVARCLQEGNIISLANRTVLISRSGQEYAIQDSVAPICAPDGKPLGVVLVFGDVTESRRMARRLAHQATHDALTELVNRREFEHRTEQALASNRKYGTQHALCFLDLDQFKLVNDTVGHVAGDVLLKQVATLLLGSVRERDTLARLGGDEFGLLLDNCPLDKASEIAETLVGTMRDFRFVWEGRMFQIGVSIGLAPITTDTDSTTQLLSQADVACYTAKDLGRNQVHVYQTAHSEPARRHMDILRAAELKDVLEQDRFRLYCQPIVPLSADNDSVRHYELLLRLLDSKGNILLPEAFISPAERYDLMAAIDRWVIRTAFHQYERIFGGSSGAEIAINLSGNSLNDKSLLRFLCQQFTDSAVPPNRVCFEITETAAIRNLSRTIQLITEMRKKGCRFALDDFGSGLSSFSYLKKLSVDYLKIDGSFVSDMANDPIDHVMVESINRVGHVMGIKTVAECADTKAVIEPLRRLGVNYVQGFAFGIPKSITELEMSTVAPTIGT